ncbi:uncharacterized protein SPPG_04566 [Spizellomyces punctatus DAOM BR117]|uniref:C2H2-type domain-containing protein n=1 Tax=Spizellomyces punctatus (strain DAOM BR117) TaxID=645134 RepID=A0A0L0HGK6_SPIPD|nr:uncharacterized protein SPPG_04566 [Spizellomyces punctatus DAOM BR117]KND00233.1 hypothetical protein SPPG_04566 [Spizellomyces punctatus DAOM BR117]|eukprot:XP_016608272.1 hypothetical protein SPPG_04566 [Spizellomyces punctatus DAOM BR117]
MLGQLHNTRLDVNLLCDCLDGAQPTPLSKLHRHTHAYDDILAVSPYAHLVSDGHFLDPGHVAMEYGSMPCLPDYALRYQSTGGLHALSPAIAHGGHCNHLDCRQRTPPNSSNVACSFAPESMSSSPFHQLRSFSSPDQENARLAMTFSGSSETQTNVGAFFPTLDPLFSSTVDGSVSDGGYHCLDGAFVSPPSLSPDPSLLPLPFSTFPRVVHVPNDLDSSSGMFSLGESPRDNQSSFPYPSSCSQPSQSGHDENPWLSPVTAGLATAPDEAGISLPLASVSPPITPATVSPSLIRRPNHASRSPKECRSPLQNFPEMVSPVQNLKLGRRRRRVTPSSPQTDVEEVKGFPCPHCPAVFTQRSQLRNHSSAHSGKPWECSYCPQRFSRKYEKVRHERSKHLHIKPYACDICNKRFSRTDALARHMLVEQRAVIKRGGSDEDDEAVFSKEDSDG